MCMLHLACSTDNGSMHRMLVISSLKSPTALRERDGHFEQLLLGLIRTFLRDLHSPGQEEVQKRTVDKTQTSRSSSSRSTACAIQID